MAICSAVGKSVEKFYAGLMPESLSDVEIVNALSHMLTMYGTLDAAAIADLDAQIEKFWDV